MSSPTPSCLMRISFPATSRSLHRCATSSQANVFPHKMTCCCSAIFNRALPESPLNRANRLSVINAFSKVTNRGHMNAMNRKCIRFHSALHLGLARTESAPEPTDYAAVMRAPI
jgi:hypothetical protein